MKRCSILVFAIALLAVGTMPGCDRWPRDPGGTLDRVRGGTLRVGVSVSPPWTEYSSGRPAGIEVALVRAFAAELGATVEWHRAGETALLQDLEHGQLDLVIGGLVMSSPWSKRVAFTQPYVQRERHGVKQAHVWAAPKGENGWVVEIERFLHAHRAEAKRLIEEADTR